MKHKICLPNSLLRSLKTLQDMFGDWREEHL